MVSFVFPHEIPTDLKKKGEYEELAKLYAKIFEPRQISERIQAITVPQESESLSYKEVLTNPEYRKATWIAVFLAFA